MSTMIVREYTGDLKKSEKEGIKGRTSSAGMRLDISFGDAPQVEVSIRRQDIFQSRAKVIVNAGNTHLGGGGGIDGAIHHKGGEEYVEAHRRLREKYQGHYTRGFAEMIPSGSLKDLPDPIDSVIVVAGPQGESTPQKENELYSCYYNALLLAQQEQKPSIAFPSISVGIFGFPKSRAAAISLKALYDFLKQYPDTTLKTISIHFLPEEPRSNLEEYANALKSHAT